MFVLFKLRTNSVGCDSNDVYELEDVSALNSDGAVNEDYINETGYELAMDNAESYGIEQNEEIEDEPFSFSYEILTGTREEIEEEYGEIVSI